MSVGVFPDRGDVPDRVIAILAIQDARTHLYALQPEVVSAIGVVGRDAVAKHIACDLPQCAGVALADSLRTNGTLNELQLDVLALLRAGLIQLAAS